METKADPLVHWVEPSAASTTAFLLVVALVCAAWLFAARRAWPQNGARPLVFTTLGLGTMLSLSALAAETGFLAKLSQSPAIAFYLGGSNLVVVTLALSPIGARMAQTVPIHWLIAVHAFRLPLELVLHAWYEQGSLPVCK